MILKLCQIYSCYPYDDHFFPQSVCSAYYWGYYSINICHSNTTNYLTQGIYLVQIRDNVNTRSAYPFVNLSTCHFSVIHKMNSSCTNMEDKKKKNTCLILWKTLLYFIVHQVLFLGNTYYIFPIHNFPICITFGKYVYWEKKKVY